MLFSPFSLTGGAQMSSGVWGLFLLLFPEQKWEEDSAQLPHQEGHLVSMGSKGEGEKEGERNQPWLRFVPGDRL